MGWGGWNSRVVFDWGEPPALESQKKPGRVTAPSTRGDVVLSEAQR